MIPPKTLQDIHPGIFRRYMEYKSMPEMRKLGWADWDLAQFRAIDKLFKGKVRVLGFYDSWHTEQAKMEARIDSLLSNKTRKFQYIYTIPDEDGYFLVVSKERAFLHGGTFRRTE